MKYKDGDVIKLKDGIRPNVIERHAKLYMVDGNIEIPYNQALNMYFKAFPEDFELVEED